MGTKADTPGTRYLTLGEYDLHGEMIGRLTALRAFMTRAARRHTESFRALAAIDVDAADATQAISRWADAHRLRGRWVHATAMETLLTWRRTGATVETGEWCAESLARAILAGPPVHRTAIYPDPLNEDLDGWIARCRDAWKAQCGALEAAGYPRAQKKAGPEHFDWLADFLIGRQSLSQIGRSVHASRQTVSDAVHRLAAFIYIELPPENH